MPRRGRGRSKGADAYTEQAEGRDSSRGGQRGRGRGSRGRGASAIVAESIDIEPMEGRSNSRGGQRGSGNSRGRGASSAVDANIDTGQTESKRGRGNSRGGQRGRGRSTSSIVEGNAHTSANSTENTGKEQAKSTGRGKNRGRGKRQKEALLEQNLLNEVNVLDEEERNHLLKNLNRLAWLLNHNTKSCTAVSLANYKLLITDNDISESTGENNQNISYINTILVKLSKLANNSRNESFYGLFVDLFVFIFEGKFKGEETGYLSSIKGDYKEEIKQRFIHFIKSDHFKKSFDNIAAMKEYVMRMMFPLLKEVKHSEQKVHTAIGLGISIIWRLQKMVPYFIGNEGRILKEALDACQASLDDNTEEDKSSRKQEETPKEDSRNIQVIRYKKAHVHLQAVPAEKEQEWLKNGQPGCAILAVNRQGTHAELRTIDCLLASNIIREPSAEEKPPEIIIGISRRCCLDCYIAILAVNDVLSNQLSSQEEHMPNICISGSHYRHFDKWDDCRPFFLPRKRPSRSTARNTSSSSAEVPSERDTVLTNKILEKFEKMRVQSEFPAPLDYMSVLEESGQSYVGHRIDDISSIHSRSSPSFSDGSAGSPRTKSNSPTVQSDAVLLGKMGLLSSQTSSKAVHSSSSSSAEIQGELTPEELKVSIMHLTMSLKNLGEDSKFKLSPDEYRKIQENLEELNDAIKERCEIKSLSHKQ